MCDRVQGHHHILQGHPHYLRSDRAAALLERDVPERPAEGGRHGESELRLVFVLVLGFGLVFGSGLVTGLVLVSGSGSGSGLGLGLRHHLRSDRAAVLPERDVPERPAEGGGHGESVIF